MSWCNFSGIVIGAAVAIYLAGRFQHPFVAVSGAGIYQERITLTFLRSSDHFLLRYVLFVTLEFALLHALLYLYLWHRRGIVSTELWRLFILSSAMLLALPMLNWGWNNEPSMRSSIPTLFISAMVTIRVLMDTPDGLPARWIRRGIAVLVALGSLNAAVEFGRQIDGVRSQGALVAVPRADAAKTLFQIQDETYREYYNFAGQYISGTQSFFAEHLARR